MVNPHQIDNSPLTPDWSGHLHLYVRSGDSVKTQRDTQGTDKQ